MARRAALRAVETNPHDHDFEAALADVQSFAESLPEKFLYCREMGHNWRPFSAGRFRDGGFERILRCTRCRTRRVQGISARGLVLSNRYEHPDGYLVQGIGHIVGEGRGVLRLESIKRIVAQVELADPIPEEG
jgi:hypothetical protein